MVEYKDGSFKSVKTIGMFALTAAAFTFLWFSKMTETTFLALVVPTFVAWLVAHVKQQQAKLAALQGTDA